MDTRRFVTVMAEESARCLDALRTADLTARVPSCPDWTAADLAWHLAEVQHFWASIVGGRLASGDDVERIPRPADAELCDLLANRTLALVDAISGRSPGDVCWSWHDDGHTVGWTARRQAHEALIHRVDAELAAGRPVTPADPALAADGIEEIVKYFLDGVPEWGAFTPDGATIALAASDAPLATALAFGRFTGTSPHTGNTYDLDATRVVEPPEAADTTLSGTAWDLDLWLWGRGGLGALTVTGRPELPERLRSVATEGTQ